MYDISLYLQSSKISEFEWNVVVSWSSSSGKPGKLLNSGDTNFDLFILWLILWHFQ